MNIWPFRHVELRSFLLLAFIFLSMGLDSTSAEAAVDPIRLPSQETVSEAQHSAYLNSRGWYLVAADEFEGTELDTQTWSYEVNCSGGGNNEKQCYTSRPENSLVRGGMLHLIAREEQYSGSPFFDDDQNYRVDDQSKTLPFTSARVRSKHKLDFKYGRVEVRAKIGGGKGMWPAIWMLPSENVYGKWPRSGEIDIMEAVNAGVAENEIHGTLHYGLPWPQWENHGQTVLLDESPAENFHVYAIEWEADEIRWYLDGQHYQTQRSEGWYNYIWQGQDRGYQVANPRAPFDQKFHIVMNLAVGGDWPGDPDRGWRQDRAMLIDYVRVYQCRAKQRGGRQDAVFAEGGEGCATVDADIKVNRDLGMPRKKEFSLFSSNLKHSSPNTVGHETKFSVTTTENNAEGPSEIFLPNSEQAIEASFSTSGSIAIKLPGNDSGAGLEMFGGAGWAKSGMIQFDMLVDSASPDSRFSIRMQSAEGEALVSLGPVEIGVWRTVHVSLSDLLANAEERKIKFDLARVITPFELLYSGASTQLEIDNIKLICAENSEPEDWQADKVCGLKSIALPEF